jgi:hypothetical protein
MEKLLFKLVAGILVCIPIVTGFIGMCFNDAFFPISVVLPEPELSLLDNEWRFMSAIWFAIDYGGGQSTHWGGLGMAQYRVIPRSLD